MMSNFSFKFIDIPNCSWNFSLAFKIIGTFTKAAVRIHYCTESKSFWKLLHFYIPLMSTGTTSDALFFIFVVVVLILFGGPFVAE